MGRNGGFGESAMAVDRTLHRFLLECCLLLIMTLPPPYLRRNLGSVDYVVCNPPFSEMSLAEQLMDSARRGVHPLSPSISEAHLERHYSANTMDTYITNKY